MIESHHGVGCDNGTLSTRIAPSRGETGRGYVSPRRVDRLLLVAVSLEVFLGGNGYLTEIGNIRFRVLLSATCIAWATIQVVSGASAKLPRQVLVLLLLFLGVTVIGVLVGVANGSQIEAIGGELKSLMYFPMIFFFAIAIRDQEDVSVVSRLIVACGIIQAIAYLSILVAAQSGVVSHSTIYLLLRESDEFIFRHNPEDEFFVGFLYKGAFHLGVAALFLLLDPVRRNKGLAAIVMAALALTLTRGLIAAFILSLVVGVLLLPKRNWVAGLLVFGAAISVVLTSTDLIMLFERPESDEIRLADVGTILAELNMPMLLFGKGLGAAIGGRERIEMTYLEVFYKQGSIGVAFWAYVLYTNLETFRRVPAVLRRQALVFCLATVFVYFATATNTFLTGSIGMSIVLISTVVLIVLSKVQWRTVVTRA
jgi:hypothetical protein